ncbi:anti-sigma F factor [Clostridium massiliamazoniense]|uniref:anti-sigma F factor n=1 Tax=Clostridium massiliamazoniense TaxID=1347366 RepID=UPI0006D77CF0|nr:anti-sigma F factor [Clostridium massiliamazoniense]
MNDNKIILEFLAKSQNEAFARVAVAAFISQLDPTLDELTDVKTAVSEAVTNAIIHGYNNDESKFVKIEAAIEDREVNIIIEDNGVGIDNIEEAREPLYTSKPELERSGMGFTVMESFMDEIDVRSEKHKGTKVIMKKKFSTLE